MASGHNVRAHCLRAPELAGRTLTYAGELLEGLLPDEEEYRAIQHRFEQRTHGPTTLGNLFGGGRWSGKPPKRVKPEDSATPEQRMALDEYRRALRIRAHPWSWLPFDEPMDSLVARSVNGSRDSPEAREQSEMSAKIWADLLADPTERDPGRGLRAGAGRQLRATPLRRGDGGAAQQDASPDGRAVPGIVSRFSATTEQAQRLAEPEAMQEQVLRERGRFSDDAQADAAGAGVEAGAADLVEQKLVARAKKRGGGADGASTAADALKEDTTLTFAKNDLLTDIAQHDTDADRSSERAPPTPPSCLPLLLHRAAWCVLLLSRRLWRTHANDDGPERRAGPQKHSASESLWSILTEARRPLDERPYNLDWPFEHCEDCREDVAAAPWQRWSMSQQAEYLTRFFPLPGSRLSNIVSDECMIKSMLALYGLDGPEWQTDGPASHVDWSRADNHGHPGSYSAAALQFHPDGVRQVRA